MTSPSPIVGTGSTSSTSTTSTPSNTLGPDSFITLLTAQLQAQDPLSPMDPDQMVDELTQINTLEQITQIRTDTDTLAGAITGGQSSSGTTGSSGTGGTGTTSSTSSAVSAAPYAARLYSQLNSNSQVI
jgi:flagellar basal-body rod modification protein FlgD